MDVELFADACGFEVPPYAYKQDRSQLIDYDLNNGPDGLEATRP
ncbi:hypothetical protein [Singulisphaera sp. PoT]